MKFIKSFCVAFALLLCAVSARAQLVYGTFTVTGTPDNTSTVTINGVSFNFTNGQPQGLYSVLITNTLGGDMTNLFNVASPLLPLHGVTGTNAGTDLIFVGIGMTGSASGSYSTFTFTTNGTTPASFVTVPISTIAAAS